MALPLKVGGQIIGALDIQSTESNAFHTDDIELFATLADQVAIAIFNNQLYVDTLNALDEAQKLHRQYLQSEWIDETAHRKTLGYLYNHSGGVVPQQAESTLWKKVFASGEPVYANLPSGGDAPDKAVMAVPIAIRGETIGVIHVQDQAEERLWSEDEVAVVNSIANQVAVALENARLFENTVRRAEREKKVLQITAKIRSTNNPEEMMQIAISELQQALRASRTQIYIREETRALDEDVSSSNGRKSKPSSDQ
jgi:GAF domain-containing protein